MRAEGIFCLQTTYRAAEMMLKLQNPVSEQVLHSDGHVKVTSKSFTVFGTMYPLRNITSVKMVMIPAKRGCAVLLLLFGFLQVFASFFAQVPDDLPDWLYYAQWGFAALVLVAAILWLRSSKTKYGVVISTAAGEETALSSTQRPYVEKIVHALNTAVGLQ